MVTRHEQGSDGKSDWLQAGSCGVLLPVHLVHTWNAPALRAQGMAPHRATAAAASLAKAFPWQRHQGDTHLLPRPLPWECVPGLSLPGIHFPAWRVLWAPKDRAQDTLKQVKSACLLRFSDFCLLGHVFPQWSVTTVKLLPTTKIEHNYWKFEKHRPLFGLLWATAWLLWIC